MAVERTETPRAKPRLLITPEPFNGTGSFNDWVDHFEGVVAVNEWDDAAMLLWMRVRLVGRAQTAYGRLPETSKASYDSLRKALKERFEPDSKKELYLSTRKRKTGEGWAEYADELRVLADLAFPDVDEKAREQLALNQYLSQLDNPQVAFNVKQKRPVMQSVPRSRWNPTWFRVPTKLPRWTYRRVKLLLQSKVNRM